MNRRSQSPRPQSSVPRPGSQGPIAALVLAGAMTVLGPVAADAIYKSVDAQSRVSYSTIDPVPGSADTVEAMRIRTAAEAPPPGTLGGAPPLGPGASPRAQSGSGREPGRRGNSLRPKPSRP